MNSRLWKTIEERKTSYLPIFNKYNATRRKKCNLQNKLRELDYKLLANIQITPIYIK